ncbi:uncharacterized protein LOC111091727 [Canis lupus familiaris]|uniref:uncharacterized protein LOC111091727 n=1 Tax=Canis lupus familiaris TaxID=9615 RepID=UPI0018F329EE|nr:uncharacterized protein LOC111091727 [Canis lupus familiaris]
MGARAVEAGAGAERVGAWLRGPEALSARGVPGGSPGLGFRHGPRPRPPPAVAAARVTAPLLPPLLPLFLFPVFLPPALVRASRLGPWEVSLVVSSADLGAAVRHSPDRCSIPRKCHVHLLRVHGAASRPQTPAGSAVGAGRAGARARFSFPMSAGLAGSEQPLNSLCVYCCCANSSNSQVSPREERSDKGEEGVQLPVVSPLPEDWLAVAGLGRFASAGPARTRGAPCALGVTAGSVPPPDWHLLCGDKTFHFSFSVLLSLTSRIFIWGFF